MLVITVRSVSTIPLSREGTNWCYVAIAGRRTPTVIIVKCGTEKEAATEKKPGNRGKRDSQLILMNFFSCVTYNDRMTPLDFDLFRKIHVLMGVTPDFFEVCLMVSNLIDLSL
jgi:chitin synthase